MAETKGQKQVLCKRCTTPIPESQGDYCGSCRYRMKVGTPDIYVKPQFFGKKTDENHRGV